MMKNIHIYILIILVFSVSGCQTTPSEISEDLPINSYFQEAQEAVVNRNDYDTALFYYNTFKERYPNELTRVLEADYEIAFIYYKKEQYDQAEEIFKSILKEYDQPNAGMYPLWPKVLSEKLLVTIEEKRQLIQNPE